MICQPCPDIAKNESEISSLVLIPSIAITRINIESDVKMCVDDIILQEFKFELLEHRKNIPDHPFVKLSHPIKSTNYLENYIPIQDESCIGETQFIDSPKQQVKNGISVENIVCKEGLELIFKSSDNSPACVKPDTAEKLILRGWANPTIKIISELNTNLEKDYRETGSVDNVIGIRGIVFDNGTSILDPWYKFEDKPDVDINNSGEIIVLYLDTNQNIIAQTGFDLNRGFNHIVTTFDFGSFALRIPVVDKMDQIILQRDGQTVATRQISPNDPTVTLLTPNGGELFIQGDIIDVTWQSSDLDGDEIFHILEFSQDGGSNWLTLAIDLIGNQFNFTGTQNIQSDSMLIRVIAIDGINTSEDISDSFFAISGQG